jgi:beta-glucosidase-like glycosyl hydrolase
VTGRAAALAAAALALAGCGGKREAAGERPGADAARAPSATGRSRALTPAQLAGQRVVFPFAGRVPPRVLLQRIRRGEAAGVVFLGANLGTAAQVRALTHRLQGVPRPPALRAPLLLMVDQEGGSVQRLPGAPSRGAPAMAATGRPAVARAEGRAGAATLRAVGMNVDLAPVVDVVRPESALHAEGRGFGFSATGAARFGAAFVHGLLEGELRASLRFDGVTISDDLEAPAFAAHGGPDGAALQATRAGVDLLLYARTYAAADRAADALAGAIRRGALDRAALDASLRRVLALRASLR